MRKECHSYKSSYLPECVCCGVCFASIHNEVAYARKRMESPNKELHLHTQINQSILYKTTKCGLNATL